MNIKLDMIGPDKRCAISGIRSLHCEIGREFGGEIDFDIRIILERIIGSRVFVKSHHQVRHEAALIRLLDGKIGAKGLKREACVVRVIVIVACKTGIEQILREQKTRRYQFDKKTT